MQVFKCFFAIVRRNLGMMIMYAVIFIAISGIITTVVPRQTVAGYEDESLPITVVDRDGSEASRALEDYLYDRQQANPLPDDRETLQDSLYRRTTWYILYIPAGYGASLADGQPLALESVGVPGSYQTAYLDSQVAAWAGAVQAYLAAGFPPGEALAGAVTDTGLQVEASLTSRQSERMASVYYYFIYLCYGLSMVMIFGLAPALLAVNRREVLARVNASALPLRRRNGQLALGALALAAAVLVAFLIVALVLYRDGLLSAGGVLCMVNAFVFLLFATALALLIGQVSKSSIMVTALANVTVMGMCFLGGIFVQPDLLGPGMQVVAKFMPFYWYAQVVRTASGLGEGVSQSLAPILEGIGIQLIFALALVSAALLVSRQKQRIG